MKITANRTVTAATLDDIRKQRDEYDAETSRLENANEEQHEKYRLAIRDKSKEIEKAISEKIGPTSLELHIRVEDDWQDAWEVRIQANENSKFEEGRALAWHWDVKFDKDGTVVKDSGSWSGLRAITSDQLADLEESIRVLKVLNNIDWYMFLKERFGAKPKYDEFIDKANQTALFDRRKNRPQFNEQLQSAQIQQLIGTDTAFRLKGDSVWKGICWIIPTAESDKFITGYIFPDYYMGRYFKGTWSLDDVKNNADMRRTSKNNLVKDSTKDGEYITVDLTKQGGQEE